MSMHKKAVDQEGNVVNLIYKSPTAQVVVSRNKARKEVLFTRLEPKEEFISVNPVYDITAEEYYDILVEEFDFANLSVVAPQVEEVVQEAEVVAEAVPEETAPEGAETPAAVDPIMGTTL